MRNKGFLTASVFLAMLQWGPPGYAVLVAPLVAWLVLTFVWRQWAPTDAEEVGLSAVLAGVVAGMLLMNGIAETQAKYHYVCVSSDDREVCTDTRRVDGPNLAAGSVSMLIGVMVFSVGMSLKSKRGS